MATKATAKSTTTDDNPPVDPLAPRPRLHRLRISNFRCIGPNPVEIELDQIVVLVGPNNAGKSSVLRAYEVVMLDGDKLGHLTIDDFPECDRSRHPTIELETVVYEGNAPHAKWIDKTSDTGEWIVRERWTWEAEGPPIRKGWNVDITDWDPKHVPWGPPNIAQINRPRAHRVSPFQDPIKQADQVVALLTEAIKSRVKDISKQRAETDGQDKSDYERLVEDVRQLQVTIAADATTALDTVCDALDETIGAVFPGYRVSLNAKPEDGLAKSLTLFKPELLMGPDGGHKASIDRQGSGACRTLLWAALRILAERQHKKSTHDLERPHVLLMDEPELCLHPDAIRESCRVLYDLPANKNWQVMITTHSPVFIDFSRDNTSIVRVERDQSGAVQGTTIYRPKKAKLDEDDKAELKALNIADPYVAEFFFGGRTVVVEGDTEFAAFKYVIDNDPKRFGNVHVVRARGKYPIATLAKVLNQFGSRYAVLHDSDVAINASGATNSAWVGNQRIRDAVDEQLANGTVRLVASLPTFERAYLGRDGSRSDKPYDALKRVREDESSRNRVSDLLFALVNFEAPLPAGAIEWSNLDELASAVGALDKPA